ncbi:glycosyltransferase [bacterium]|nr:glycosyltransferase [bacterium]
MPPNRSKSYLRKKQQIVGLLNRQQAVAAFERLTELISSHPNDYELHYLVGMAHTESHRYLDAIRSFEQALRLNSKHGDSYFQIGLAHTKLCRFNKALDYLQKARTLKSNLAETNYYLEKIAGVARPADVTLSACLIVKDEEKHLPSCLRSISAVVDEIIVVDTGSTDKTITIAEAFGAKVSHYSWQGDFASARNFANKQATGEWILQIDADEELFPEDQHKVREVIHQDQCNGAYLALHNRVSSSFGEGQPSMHYLVRLFKNREDFYFENAIHEVLRISGEVLAVDINLLHHGYNQGTDHLLNKRKRNSEILYRQLEENPDKLSTLFYLSMLHIGSRELDLAESFALKALEKLGNAKQTQQHLYLMTLNNLALIAMEKGEHEDVLRYSLSAIETNENYLDPYYLLGLAHFRAGDYEKTKEIYEQYLEIYERITDSPVFNLFANSASTYLFQVYHTLGKIHRREHDQTQAHELLSKAVELNPNFWIGLVDLAYLYMDQGEWQQAADHLDRGISLAKNNPEVAEDNEMLWADFTNAVKNYIKVFQKINSHEQARSSHHYETVEFLTPNEMPR